MHKSLFAKWKNWFRKTRTRELGTAWAKTKYVMIRASKNNQEDEGFFSQ
ncbi:MAG: hypothetical protein JST10_06155 [Bacteroidetes bacterium]|nr:hypothetical protein [Bacteroidota bacterium]